MDSKQHWKHIGYEENTTLRSHTVEGMSMTTVEISIGILAEIIGISGQELGSKVIGA